MNQREAFLRDIVEHPGDDAPRLIFADWLEEQGDGARAEFIRLQCALDGMSPEDARQAVLRARGVALLGQHEKHWTAELGGLVESGIFRRGFLEEVTVRASVFLEQAEALFRLAPLRRVCLRGAAPVLDSVVKVPQLALLEGLDLRGNILRDTDLAVLACCPYLQQCGTLVLRNNVLTAVGIEGLIRGSRLSSLRSLNLGLNLLDPAALRLLSRAPLTRGLRELYLDGNSRLGAGVGELRAAPPGQLRCLSLGSVILDAAGARSLAGCDCLGGLTRLELGWNRLGDEGARELAGAAWLTSVSGLDLAWNGIGAEGARALARSPHLEALRSLELAYNRVGDEGLLELLSAEGLTSLRHLDLRNTGISDDGVRRLLRSPAAGRLDTLLLSSTSLTSETRARVAQSSWEGVLRFGA
jgi:uncharacterized protein (TIGR02996 family)